MIRCMFFNGFSENLRLPVALRSRSFSVKELSWCAPKGSPNRNATRIAEKISLETVNNNSPEPIDRFGIVAAMARGSRVMGVNGKLPWDLPADRKHFVGLTRDKILIMGRQTYEEEESKSHISHAGYNIVISSTIERLSDHNEEIAHSFPEALHLAKLTIENMDQNPDTIACWIVGGERIYDEALKHPSAEELHLTIVDTDIDVAQYGPNTRIAMFPAKYRWDRHFDEVSRSSQQSMDRDGNSLTYTHVLYRRKRSR